jgi:hypothetical protein
LVSEPARDREPDRDLSSELFSARPEAEVTEPDRDLKREIFSARPEATIQVAVRVVEQERGLELQVNCPEFTLATMLPIVNVIEAAMVLKIELFSAKLEAIVQAPFRDLKREFFSARPEANASEALRAFARPLISEAATEREPDRDLSSELFSAKPEAKASEPVKALARPLT